ncbi:MAG: helix-turn-helix domain-containing protein [Oscillospiraceae bacterium]|nr:helix-turn-helix domain-containing protein [Oscillospiraceae bacterium]
MSEISQRILEILQSKDISYGELSERTAIPKSALQRYATGQTEKIPIDRLQIIAGAIGVSTAYLMGWENSRENKLPDNILPMPEMRKIPLLGTIACGAPILAEEHIEDHVDIPKHIHADFALKCKGDSMINARIFDGDIVYIRQQEEVANGEIAAVLIDDNATLKRVKIYEDRIVLEPANPLHDPLVFRGEEMNTVHILGKAVAFTSTVR